MRKTLRQRKCSPSWSTSTLNPKKYLCKRIMMLMLRFFRLSFIHPQLPPTLPAAISNPKVQCFSEARRSTYFPCNCADKVNKMFSKLIHPLSKSFCCKLKAQGTVRVFTHNNNSWTKTFFTSVYSPRKTFRNFRKVDCAFVCRDTREKSTHQRKEKNEMEKFLNSAKLCKNSYFADDGWRVWGVHHHKKRKMKNDGSS